MQIIRQTRKNAEKIGRFQGELNGHAAFTQYMNTNRSDNL